MNENESNELAARFQLDQDQAAQEAQSRSDTAWALHVGDAEAQIGMKVAAAELEEAKAMLWRTVAAILGSAAVLAVVYLLVLAVVAVVRWFA